MTISDLSSERIKKLQAKMLQAGVDLVALAPTANMRYLLGFAPLADERPCFLLVGPQATQLVIPELNAQQVESHTGHKVRRWSDALGPEGVLAQALAELGIKAPGVLAIDDTMRADVCLFLQSVVQLQQSIVAGGLMTELRVCKSTAELELMAQAAALADKAILAGVEACQPGLSEREVANRIATFFRDNGAESVDFTLVAAGPNSAFPHHETGGRQLQQGDTIILDIGATLNGYKSDITRVVQLGKPTAEVQKVYDLVREANYQGRKAAVAGATARAVDQATWRVIEEGGYGEYFFHRTGHGLGVEIHEPPWITSESETGLKPGMVFSVEPGIYLSGKFGIRIEDIVAVTEGESHRLTGLGHELIVKT